MQIEEVLSRNFQQVLMYGKEISDQTIEQEVALTVQFFKDYGLEEG